MSAPSEDKPAAPPSTLRLSQTGAEILREREGCKLTAYQDTVGVWTIGYGHAATSGVPPIPVAGMTITQVEADAILAKDDDWAESAVRKHIKADCKQWEFDAFVSLAFNLGETQFAGATFVDRHNAGDKKGCAEAITWWDKPSEIKTRRYAEKYQYLGYEAVARCDAEGDPVA